VVAERPNAGISPQLPLTKFRTPRARRDIVPREALVARLRALSADHPVTLVAAPAGYGKTTLLAQLAAAAPADEAVVWVALDESDNDPGRLLATLVRSLQPLELAWDLDVEAGVANAAGGGSEARAVLAGIVNALCTLGARRLTWILDDVHRLDDPAALSLLDALVERLPDHVGLVLGSRTEPGLPLARLRAHGELGELDTRALSLDEESIATLARLRLADGVPAGIVKSTLERTGGWAVGVNLMLAARPGPALSGVSPGPNAGGPAPSVANPRALFDFLAQEVLDELPPALRELCVSCSVLPELSPARCEAVAGVADGREALEELLRRHLFVTVVDEAELVMRFHDLFRDFLLAQLARRPPQARLRLHAQAAAAEPQPERAIAHWLDARRWAEAVDLIVAHGLRMAGEGAYASLERWIERLPPEAVAAEPRLALLRAECAWSRWDWESVLRFAAPATEGLSLTGDLRGRLRAQLLLCASRGALGLLDEREALTEQSFQLELRPIEAAQFHLQRAWTDFSLGRPERVAGHLATMNDLVASNPEAIAPAVSQTLNCHFGGLPGVAEAFLRFTALCHEVPRPSAMPWQAKPFVLGAWAALWQGRRDAALRQSSQAEQLQHSFGKVRFVLMDTLHLRALLAAAQGDTEAACDALSGLLQDLDGPDADGLRRAWQRPYRCVLARALWMAQDVDRLRDEARRLDGPPRAQEWPLVAGAVATVQGQAALLAGDLAQAHDLLATAVSAHARYPAPAFSSDPRVALARLHLLCGERHRAWTVFQPVLAAVGRAQLPGHLLLEPPAVVDELLALCPAGCPEQAVVESARRVLQAWRPSGALANPASSRVARREGGQAAAARQPGTDDARPALGPVAMRLTEREREVMALVARGMSNKHLARDLSLSAHTVKRHLANILDKLDCDNRVQAADLWRGDSA
jgi:LuxR family maltose regulon positive regulatory protein